MSIPVREATGYIHELDCSQASPAAEQLGILGCAFTVTAIEGLDYTEYSLSLELPPFDALGLTQLLHAPYRVPTSSTADTHAALRNLVFDRGHLASTAAKLGIVAGELTRLRPAVEPLMDTLESSDSLSWEDCIVHVLTEADKIDLSTEGIQRLDPNEFNRLCKEAEGIHGPPVKLWQRHRPDEVAANIRDFVFHLETDQFMRLYQAYDKRTYVEIWSEYNHMPQCLYIPIADLPTNVDRDSVYDLKILGEVRQSPADSGVPLPIKNRAQRQRKAAARPISQSVTSDPHHTLLRRVSIRHNVDQATIVPAPTWMRTSAGEGNIDVYKKLELDGGMLTDTTVTESQLAGALVLATMAGRNTVRRLSVVRKPAYKAALGLCALKHMEADILGSPFVRSLESFIAS